MLFAPGLRAEVGLSPLFGDHAVLPRDVPIPIWGSAEPGERVTVEFGADRADGTADARGRWLVRLPPRPASGAPTNLVVRGSGGTLTRRDIVVGDVWLASGQSNMEMAFFWTRQGKETAKTIHAPLIRLFDVPDLSKDTPQSDLARGGWAVCSGSGCVWLSQLGTFFAQELQQKLDIPVGVIVSACSGTRIEAWISADALAADPAGPATRERWQKVLAEFPAKKAQYETDKAAWAADQTSAAAQGKPFKKQPPLPPSGPGSMQAPSGLYNAMIHPLAPYALRGVIWYQGENNTKNAKDYRTLFPSLIQDWRHIFSQDDLPFYWVQLPGYNMGTEYGDDWAGVREAQSMALSLANTGQAVTIDIGEGNNVHPDNKPEVGRRLALLALARTYGDKTVTDSGPVFDRAEFHGTDPVRIFFKNAAGGLTTKAGDATGALAGFEAAGEDKKFYPAEARIDGETGTVRVSCRRTPVPVAIRYAWRNNPTGLTLINRAGLPLPPFRTDNW